MPAPDFYRNMDGMFAQNITIGDRTYKGYIKEQQHSFRDFEYEEGGPGFIGRRPHEVTMTVVLLDGVEFPAGETIKTVELSLDEGLSIETKKAPSTELDRMFARSARELDKVRRATTWAVG